MQRGEGYLWAPGHDILARVMFPVIRTDLTAIVTALAVSETGEAGDPKADRRQHVAKLERALETAKARIAALEHENHDLAARLQGIAALARRFC